MTARDDLFAHLQSGCTTVCRAWAVLRKDGASYGFTDHDAGFAFDGIAFKASTGMSAKALQQATGLSVDNTETTVSYTHLDVYKRQDRTRLQCAHAGR